MHENRRKAEKSFCLRRRASGGACGESFPFDTRLTRSSLRSALCTLHAARCTLHAAHIARQPLDAATCRTPPRRTPHAACCMLHATTTSLHTACHPPARYTHCSQNVAPAFIWRTCTLAAVRACKFMCVCVCVCACACVVGVSTRTNECVRIGHRFEPLSAHERLHVRLCARTPQRARAPVQVYSCLSTRACVGVGAIAVQVTVCAQFVGWSADHRGRRESVKNA